MQKKKRNMLLANEDCENGVDFASRERWKSPYTSSNCFESGELASKSRY